MVNISSNSKYVRTVLCGEKENICRKTGQTSSGLLDRKCFIWHFKKMMKYSMQQVTYALAAMNT